MYLYTYCVIRKEKEIGNYKGIENEKVKSIEYKDIKAIVSPCSDLEYDPTKEKAKKHEKVIKKVMEDHTVIPMSFGMVFKNEEILKNVLKKSYTQIKTSLKKLDGKIELGVKVLGEKGTGDEIFEELSEISSSAVKGDLFSDKLGLNGSFLVNEDEIDNFSEKVGNIKEEYDNNLKYTGPWPPYNFVEIEIRGE